MRLKLSIASASALALVAAVTAFAQVTDRYRVASAALVRRHYSPTLFVVIPSPPDYVGRAKSPQGGSAIWEGPRYQATGRPSLGGNATVSWIARIERYPANRASLLANLVHNWQPISGGSTPIERRVGGRRVGTIKGTWVLTKGDEMAGEARYEAGLVFPLCGRTAHLYIDALTPSGDSAGGTMGFGEYVIEGMAPTAWNREQVMTTLNNVRLEGNLPTGRVTAARRGAAIAGRVADCNRHPVAGQAVVLERQSGSGWTRVAAGKTTASGAYSLRPPGAGVYRVAAGTRASNTVRIG